MFKEYLNDCQCVDNLWRFVESQRFLTDERIEEYQFRKALCFAVCGIVNMLFNVWFIVSPIFVVFAIGCFIAGIMNAGLMNDIAAYYKKYHSSPCYANAALVERLSKYDSVLYGQRMFWLGFGAMSLILISWWIPDFAQVPMSIVITCVAVYRGLNLNSVWRLINNSIYDKILWWLDRLMLFTLLPLLMAYACNII